MKQKLLTFEEEKELATTAQYVLRAEHDLEEKLERKPLRKEVAEKLGISTSTLRRKEELALEARNELVKRNTGLVSSIVNFYVRNGDPSLRPDLEQEGAQGLIKAAERFDPSMEYRFSTYASWWVRQAINLYLSNNGRTVRRPVYVVEMIAKITNARAELHEKLKREPSDEELAGHLDIDVKKLNEYTETAQATASLDFDIGEGTTLGDVLEDADYTTPDTLIEQEERHKILHEVLKEVLTPREEYVIRMRFGIGTDEEHTLEDIGNKLDLTKERIRQIEAQALAKLGKRQSISMLQKVG